MANDKMVKMIQDRIQEMVKHPDVQKLLVARKMNGATDAELKQFVANAAIATLYGAKA